MTNRCGRDAGVSFRQLRTYAELALGSLVPRTHAVQKIFEWPGRDTGCLVVEGYLSPSHVAVGGLNNKVTLTTRSSTTGPRSPSGGTREWCNRQRVIGIRIYTSVQGISLTTGHRTAWLHRVYGLLWTDWIETSGKISCPSSFRRKKALNPSQCEPISR
jgi:hypothetical protein